MLGTVFYACMTLILLASLPVWRKIYRRYSQKQPIIEPRPQVASPIGLIDVIVLLTGWLTSQLIAGGLFMFASGVDPSELASVNGSQMVLLMLLAGLGQLIAVALGMVYLLARYSSAAVLGWYPSFIRTDLKLACLGFLLIAPVIMVLQLLLSLLVEYKHPALDAMVEDANVFTVISVWFAAVIAAPIAEEVVFRGWIQNWLQRVSFRHGKFGLMLAGGWPNQSDPDWDSGIEIVEAVLKAESDSNAPYVPTGPSNDNPYEATDMLRFQEANDARNRTGEANVPSLDPVTGWAAIVIASLLFAVMHLGQGLAPIPLFGFSLLLGYLYQRTGSLLPSIGLHMINNGYSVFWLTMQILTGEAGDLP